MDRYAIIFVGLPGSGKTTKAKFFLTLSLYKDFTLLDDPTSGENGILIDLLEGRKNVIICDPHLCNPENRKLAQSIFDQWGYEVLWYFFENDVEKCRANVAHGDDGRVIENFDHFKYEIPEGTDVLPIWENKN